MAQGDTDEAKDLRSKYELLEAHLTAALTGLTQLAGTEKSFYTDVHQCAASVAEFLGFNPDGSRLMEDVRTASLAVMRKPPPPNR